MDLIVADGKGDSKESGVSIHDVGKPTGRVDRIGRATRRVYEAALSLNADLYHLHDPELIRIGLQLKRLGKRVIFDSHEDVPKQILGKSYLHPLCRKVISLAVGAYEAWALHKLDGVIAAAPFIEKRLRLLNECVATIANYPRLAECGSPNTRRGKIPQVCYVGCISRSRGIYQLCEAVGNVYSPVRFAIAGKFDNQADQSMVTALDSWKRIDYHGFVDRAGVIDLMAQSIAGLVTWLPLPNYINNQPVKMFEYMGAGIAVIASDFPECRKIIHENHCGMLVNPLKPQEMAKAIEELVANPGMALHMGENGFKAVQERYNWAIEEKKLMAFYQRVLD
jgi:glycosyltransferase involved in cell wall biosynthesis